MNSSESSKLPTNQDAELDNSANTFLALLQGFPALAGVSFADFLETPLAEWEDEFKRLGMPVAEKLKFRRIYKQSVAYYVPSSAPAPIMSPRLQVDEKCVVNDICVSFGSMEPTQPVQVPSDLCERWMMACMISLSEAEMKDASVPPEDLIQNGAARLSVLGEGAHGKVYEGKLWNPITFKYLRLAVKVCSAALKVPIPVAGDLTRVSMDEPPASVRNEINVLSAFRHVNIIKLLAFSWKPPRMHLVYELAEGGSLEGQLSDDCLAGNLSWAKRVGIARGVVSALQHMHSGDKGKQAVAFHRDLKAAKVVLSAGYIPTPKLIDCGLAKFFPCGDRAAAVPNSVIDKVWGTPGYMCPRYLAHPERGYSSQNEVYSFGVLLAELFTGRLQNRGRTDHSREGISDALPDPRAGVLPQHAERALRALACSCLATDPDQRPDFKQIDERVKFIQNACSSAASAEIKVLNIPRYLF
jgi:hypothetical protein